MSMNKSIITSDRKSQKESQFRLVTVFKLIFCIIYILYGPTMNNGTVVMAVPLKKLNDNEGP